MSSLGDVVHCLPALTDLLHAEPDVDVDWVVEEAFESIPRFHPGVRRVIPVAIRRWRKNWWRYRQEVSDFLKALRQEQYDCVVDAQGLIKSALVSRMARGNVSGFDRRSAREPLASVSYQNGVSVPRGLHAVERQRQLFAHIFQYSRANQLNYGLSGEADPGGASKDVYFFHGTTWASKHWPNEAWLELAERCSGAGYRVVLPFINEAEQKRAEGIAKQVPTARLLAPGSLALLGQGLSKAAGAVSVDTGLGHLAAAFNIPVVAVYGATNPNLTGVTGPQQVSIADSDLSCSPCLNRACKYAPESSKIHPPCFERVTPERVFSALVKQLQVNE